MGEFEIITINDKEYAILNEVQDDENSYIYLANIADHDDIMIRKRSHDDTTLYIPLDDDEEFQLANLLLLRQIYDNEKSDY